MKKRFGTGLVAAMLTSALILGGCTSAEAVKTTSADTTKAATQETSSLKDETTPTSALKEIEIVFLEGTDGNSWRTQCENSMQTLANQYMADGTITKYKLLVANNDPTVPVSYTHLRAHETDSY